MTTFWQFEDSVTWTHGGTTLICGQFWRQIIKTFYAGNNASLAICT